MKFKSHFLLYISGLFGLFAVMVSSMGDLETMEQKIWISLILISISVLFLSQHWFHSFQYGNLIRHTLQTILAGCLFIFSSDWSVFPIVFFVLSPQVMMDFPLKTGILWLVVYTVITGAAGICHEGLKSLLDMLPYTAGYVFFGFFGWTMMQADAERKRSNQLFADLTVVHEKLQRYTEQVKELTIAEERNRIAREMHDTLGHRLTIAAVQLDGARRLIHTNPQKVEQIINTVHEQVKDGLAELRRTVAIMRAPMDDDLTLTQALARLVNQVRDATGMEIHLEMDEKIPVLPSSHRHAMFRAAQEGLTNIERHASAREVWINLHRAEEMIHLVIEDDGVGLPPESGKVGLGLTGMRERAALLDGSMNIQPRVGGGTTLRFSLPITKD